MTPNLNYIKSLLTVSEDRFLNVLIINGISGFKKVLKKAILEAGEKAEKEIR